MSAPLAEAYALIHKGQVRADAQQDGVSLAARGQPEGMLRAQKVGQALAQFADVALPGGMGAEVRAIEDGVQADDADVVGARLGRCLLYTSSA